MSEANGYVRKDEHGVYRVGETRVSLDSVVIAFRDGASAEAIHGQYPSLTLEQVYGAVAYYLGHMDEVDRYLEQQDQVWEQWRKRSAEDPAPAISRLRTLRQSQAGQRP
jgi:uncharacterized protein (DUF433 family)